MLPVILILPTWVLVPPKTRYIRGAILAARHHGPVLETHLIILEVKNEDENV